MTNELDPVAEPQTTSDTRERWHTDNFQRSIRALLQPQPGKNYNQIKMNAAGARTLNDGDDDELKRNQSKPVLTETPKAFRHLQEFLQGRQIQTGGNAQGQSRITGKSLLPKDVTGEILVDSPMPVQSDNVDLKASPSQSLETSSVKPAVKVAETSSTSKVGIAPTPEQTLRSLRNGGDDAALFSNSDPVQEERQHCIRYFYDMAVERLSSALKRLGLERNQSKNHLSCFAGVDWQACPPMERLSAALQLTEKDKHLLLLCFLFHYDRQLASLCKDLIGQSQPNLSLAAYLINEGKIVVFSSNSPLRAWNLLSLESTGALQSSPLVLDEYCFHFLLEQSSLPAELNSLLQPSLPAYRLLESQRPAAMHALKLISHSRRKTQRLPIPLIYFQGDVKDLVPQVEVLAAQVSHFLKGQLYVLRSGHLPRDINSLERLAVFMRRQFLLQKSHFLIEASPQDYHYLDYLLLQLTQPMMPSADQSVMSRGLQSFCFLVGGVPDNLCRNRYISVGIDSITKEEKTTLWLKLLPQVFRSSSRLDIENLVDEFNLSYHEMVVIASYMRATYSAEVPSVSSESVDSDNDTERENNGSYLSDLWHACFQQTRSAEEELMRVFAGKD